MADFKQNQNSEDAQAAQEQAKADAAAADAARVEAEEQAARNAADAEAAKQTEQAKAEAAAAEAARDQAEAQANDPEPTVSVVLDPEFAEEYDTDSASVGTANGEYVLTADAIEVPQSDSENVLVSPAAKEVE